MNRSTGRARKAMRVKRFDEIRYRALVNDLVIARMAMGITQTEMAGIVGTTQHTMSEIESGRRSPRITTLMRYARALEIRIRFKLEFYGEDGPYLEKAVIRRRNPDVANVGAPNR